jgi:hypothetical protein
MAPLIGEGDPRKAYQFTLRADAGRDFIVWGDTREDALQRFLNGKPGEDFLALDDHYAERPVRVHHLRRAPREDRR